MLVWGLIKVSSIRETIAVRLGMTMVFGDCLFSYGAT